MKKGNNAFIIYYYEQQIFYNLFIPKKPHTKNTKARRKAPNPNFLFFLCVFVPLCEIF